MATLSVIGWRSLDLTWSGWTDHSRAELRRRLRRSVEGPPALMRTIEQKLKRRENVTIEHVKTERVEEMRHIIEALGAQVLVSQ